MTTKKYYGISKLFDSISLNLKSQKVYCMEVLYMMLLLENLLIQI
jgi:hypothetical protein